MGHDSRGECMKNIAIITATRAEFGLLYHTAKAIHNHPDFELNLIVTGTHLSREYGYTLDEIISSELPINAVVDMGIGTDNTFNVTKSIAILIEGLANIFQNNKPDALMILGDRYELLGVISVGITMKIPIIHLCGGESTEGAIDEQVRHAVTKAAHLHFVQNKVYLNNLVKMGEEDWRVHDVGYFAYEGIKKLDLLTKKQLENQLDINFEKTIVLVGYHPVTLEGMPLEEQMNNLFQALQKFDVQIIFTFPNADEGSNVIIKSISQFAATRPNTRTFKSLGQLKYYSLLKHASIMVGNSSSGILEAPFFGLPVVNIGIRQQGRIRQMNVIDVGYNTVDIISGMKKALSKDFGKLCIEKATNLRQEDTSSVIVKNLENDLNNPMLLRKRLVV